MRPQHNPYFSKKLESIPFILLDKIYLNPPKRSYAEASIIYSNPKTVVCHVLVCKGFFLLRLKNSVQQYKVFFAIPTVFYAFIIFR